MEVQDARKLKQLEEENKRLKELVADLSLDKRRSRICSQKLVKPADKRRTAKQNPDDAVITNRTNAITARFK